MTLFDPQGWAVSNRIKIDRYSSLRHGTLGVVHGIIVHQTGGSTAASTLAKYRNGGPDGAHFLIDKDGTIIQTASVLWKLQHVGPLKARCLAEHRCSPIEARTLLHLGVMAAAMHELAKPVPLRYPANKDAIGIEIVGKPTFPDKIGEPYYEVVTPPQNVSLKWLVGELRQALKVPLTEVFRHPDVARKDPHEAETAQW